MLALHCADTLVASSKYSTRSRRVLSAIKKKMMVTVRPRRFIWPIASRCRAFAAALGARFCSKELSMRIEVCWIHAVVLSRAREIQASVDLTGREPQIFLHR